MACKGAKKKQAEAENLMAENTQPETKEVTKEKAVDRLFFGVDSQIQSDDVLQNNITEFEWVVRNKVYPNFWGRNLVGENCLTKKEIDFLHEKGCKIVAIYNSSDAKQTEEQGKIVAKKIDIVAMKLGIPQGTAIFLKIGERENITRDYMRGFAEGLIEEGFTPAFKANTDANISSFDREFSRGLQTDREVFNKCLIWTVSPSLAEYDRVTTTHLIHPDNWIPFAPSGIKREDIAIWQYGRDCHPISDDKGKETTFNVNLIKREDVYVNFMF